MIETLIRNWWLLALRGVLAAVFSVITFMMRSSVQTFTLREFATRGSVIFLGMLALAAGACTIAAGIWTATRHKWWLLVVDGLAVSAVGFTLILSDRITFHLVANLLVALAMAVGVSELITARMLRHHVPDEWFLVLAGAASIGFALSFLWIKPEVATAFNWLAAYSAFTAICMAALALRLRNLRRTIHRIAQSASHSG